MTIPILLLNCGSSSIKYQVIDTDVEEVVASGIIQRIGSEPGTLDHTYTENTTHVTRGFPSQARALAYLVSVFDGVRPKRSDVVAVGHRAVHGGAAFRPTVVIDGGASPGCAN